jgi:hypothetical protein
MTESQQIKRIQEIHGCSWEDATAIWQEDTTQFERDEDTE